MATAVASLPALNVQPFAPLSREAETDLARRWRDSQDETAAEELTKAHLRYVVATASKYRRYGLPMDELIAEGNFGLVHALGKFDPDRGARFVTYAAYWIRAYILNYVLRSWSLVGSGAGALRSKMFFKLRRERARVNTKYSDPEQAHSELARRLDVSEDRLREMLQRLDSRDLSLDLPVGEGAGASLVDTLPASHEMQDAQLERTESSSELSQVISQAVMDLDERERFIVQRRMLADREDELSLAEIGRQLGVSRERARQLETRAKGKLRARLGRHRLDSAA